MVFEEKLSHFPARGLEWFSGFMLVTWGLDVLIFPGMFEGPQKMIFVGLLSMLSQPTWGLLSLMMGMIKLYALWINGRHARTPLARLVTSFGSIFLWFCVTIGLLKSGIPSTGLALYPWLVIQDMYSASRAASDLVEAEAQRRLHKINNGSNDVSRATHAG